MKEKQKKYTSIARRKKEKKKNKKIFEIADEK